MISRVFGAIWAPSLQRAKKKRKRNMHLNFVAIRKKIMLLQHMFRKKKNNRTKKKQTFFSPFPLQLLRDKFREFARETGMAGQERVDMVNLTIDELIEGGHTESASMAEWKDAINESWADLLELIDTRAQLLATSYELLK